MYLEQLEKDYSARDIISDAIANLRGLHVFPALIELMFRRTRSQPSQEKLTVEQAAMNDSYRNGYLQAIEDFTDFAEYLNRNKSSAQRRRPQPDFGAAKILLDRGEISEDEYRKLTT